MMQADAQETFNRRIEHSRRVLVTTHMNPDGDAIGSLIAVARLLKSLGREVHLVNQDRTPRALEFLEDDRHRVEVYDPPRHDPVLEAVDLAVLVDNSTPDRLGRMETPMLRVASKTLCIDHHPTRGTPWAHNILDPQASATAAMIYELLEARGWKLDRPTAEALYVGIASDTGFFRFNSTSSRAHEIAATLLREGVDPARCFQRIHERNSAAYTRLLGHALAGLRLDADGAVASVQITRELTERCGAQDEDTSEMTTSLLSMDGVWIALLFRELGDGRVKVSLRSKGDMDVHRLAAEFGGGGHRNASGIVVEESMTRVQDRVIERACALVAERARRTGP